VNFPAAVADAAEMLKGEVWEWQIEDRNTFVFKRKEPNKSLLKGI
jgi:hypothetical protein